MSKVTLWKAADGSLHETHKAFLAHEAKAKIVYGVGSSTKLNDMRLFQFNDDENEGQYMNVADIPYFIADNATELKLILDNALVNKRIKSFSSAHLLRSGDVTEFN